jgi:plastocyanin
VRPFLRASLIASHLLAAIHLCSAGASLEGKVTLPRSASAAPATPRYAADIAAKVGPPAPSVAVVYLVGDFLAPPATNVTAEVIQERFQFRPAVLPVRKGTTIEFPNRDDLYHSVFSYSKPKRFDLGRYRKDEKPAAIVFDQAGIVKLYCEIHEHMRATILVLDTPHFVCTDTNGIFRLENLPVGTFMLKAWIDDKTEREQSVTLTDGATVQVDFSKP